MVNLLARRCLESKSLVRGVEMSTVIAAVPGGHRRARAAPRLRRALACSPDGACGP